MQSAEIDIYPLRYPAGLLKALPEDEAMFFLMFGQMHNDVNVLIRLIIQSRRVNGGDEASNRVCSVSASFAIRMLAARLHEGGKLIKGRFNKIFANLGNLVPASTRVDLSDLLTYFSRNNYCKVVRDNLASHFDQDLIKRALLATPVDTDLVDFYTDIDGNTTFCSAETVLAGAFADLSCEKSSAGTEKVLAEITDISRKLNNVIRAYLNAFSILHFDSDVRVKTAVQRRTVAAYFSEFIAPVFPRDDASVPSRRRLAALMNSSAPGAFFNSSSNTFGP